MIGNAEKLNVMDPSILHVQMLHVLCNLNSTLTVGIPAVKETTGVLLFEGY